MPENMEVTRLEEDALRDGQPIEWKWFDIAEEYRQPWEQAASQAKAVRGGRPDTLLESVGEEPPSNRNRFATEDQTRTGVMVRGRPEPRVSNMKHKPHMSKMASWTNQEIAARFSMESFAAIMREMHGNLNVCNMGFIAIWPDGDMESLNWFDVYFDAVLSRPSDLWRGRFVIVRRLVDHDDFLEEYEQELKEQGLNPEELDPNAHTVPGRETVGADLVQDYVVYDKDTATAYKTKRSSVINAREEQDLSDQRLSEVFIGFFSKGRGGGWYQADMYEGPGGRYVLRKQDVDTDYPTPGIFGMPFDPVTGSMYGPSLYTHMGFHQAFINYIRGRWGHLLTRLSNIPLIMHDVDKNRSTEDEEGGRWSLLRPDLVKFLEFPRLGSEVFNIDQTLKEDERETNSQDIMQGNPDYDGQSGRAMRIQTENSITRLTPAIQAQGEMLSDIGRHMGIFVYKAAMQQARMEAWTKGMFRSPGEKMIPEMIPADVLINYIPKPFLPDLPDDPAALMELTPDMVLEQIVKIEDIRDGLKYRWDMKMTLDSEEEMALFEQAFERYVSIAQGDLVLAARLAGKSRKNVELAELFETEITNRQAEVAAMMPPEEEGGEVTEEGEQGEEPAPAAPVMAPQPELSVEDKIMMLGARRERQMENIQE